MGKECGNTGLWQVLLNSKSMQHLPSGDIYFHGDSSLTCGAECDYTVAVLSDSKKEPTYRILTFKKKTKG